MGLLDDAIREHLELKRRRGADSSEVARQEQEAFGPPRRGDLAVDDGHDHHDHDEHDGHDHEPALDEPAAFAAEPPPALQAVDDAGWEDDEDEDEAPAEPATRIHAPRLAPDPEPEPFAAPDQHHDEEPAPPVEREPPPGAVSASRLADEAGQPTREFDSHELREATEEPAETPAPAPRADEDPEEDADVLEETPEFLQETPEHDRLWFEQRPPRDFDF